MASVSRFRVLSVRNVTQLIQNEYTFKNSKKKYLFLFFRLFSFCKPKKPHTGMLLTEIKKSYIAQIANSNSQVLLLRFLLS